MLLYHLPRPLRIAIARTHLGPAGGWFAKDKLVGRVPLLLGYLPEAAEIAGEKIRLRLRGEDGITRDVTTDHVIAATGYRVDLERLSFLSPAIRSQLETVLSAPVLSSNFETSVPGLHFIGIAAINSFGPVMRFAFGARFAAQRIATMMASGL